MANNERRLRSNDSNASGTGQSDFKEMLFPETELK